MRMQAPVCRDTTDKHCSICVHGHQMICCECGDALTPWHADIHGLVMDGELKKR